MALGALRLLIAKEDSFEFVAASVATVLENWHNRSRGKPQQGRGERHNPTEDDTNIIDVRQRFPLKRL